MLFRSLVDDKALFALLVGNMGESGAEKSGSYYEIVVFLVVHILILMIDESFCKGKEF